MTHEYTFNGQRDGEEIEEVINGHPYLMYKPGIKTMALLLVGVAVILFAPKFYLASIIIFIFAVAYLFYAFYSYKESITIITDQRIFAIDQRGFFKRKITEMELDQIIDMSSETGGLVNVMLKYGDLIIRSAGSRENGSITLKDIPSPYDVQQRIASLKKSKGNSI